MTYWTVRVVNFAHGSFLMFGVMLSLALFKAGASLIWGGQALAFPAILTTSTDYVPVLEFGRRGTL